MKVQENASNEATTKQDGSCTRKEIPLAVTHKYCVVACLICASIITLTFPAVFLYRDLEIPLLITLSGIPSFLGICLLLLLSLHYHEQMRYRHLPDYAAQQLIQQCRGDHDSAKAKLARYLVGRTIDPELNRGLARYFNDRKVEKQPNLSPSIILSLADALRHLTPTSQQELKLLVTKWNLAIHSSEEFQACKSAMHASNGSETLQLLRTAAGATDDL